MIFCLPIYVLVLTLTAALHNKLTVSAWLNRSLDVSNALDSHAVLIIPVHKLVFKLANLVGEHTEFVSDI